MRDIFNKSNWTNPEEVSNFLDLNMKMFIVKRKKTVHLESSSVRQLKINIVEFYFKIYVISHLNGLKKGPDRVINDRNIHLYIFIYKICLVPTCLLEIFSSSFFDVRNRNRNSVTILIAAFVSKSCSVTRRWSSGTFFRISMCFQRNKQTLHINFSLELDWLKILKIMNRKYWFNCSGFRINMQLVT